MKFKELGLSENILKAIYDLGYNEATYIQNACIPIILNNRDILGQSQTGTGKTAAFGLPLIEKIKKSEGKRKPQALVLSPTRELSLQVSNELRKFSKYIEGIKVVTIYGGTSFQEQIKNIKQGCEIIVGCPGRVLDHLEKKTLKLDECNLLVLDEADEMLNMGFREDIEKIIEFIPETRQTLLFSATMPQAIKDIASNYQKDPLFIKNPETKLTGSTITQLGYEVAQKDKEKVLIQALEIRKPKMAMIFCNTKKMVDDLCAQLVSLNYPASAIHGDMKQEARTKVMERFKKGQINYLICTDVASRGIDVNNMDMVINYDLPQENEYYVHRIGRCGRAGKQGVAITLFTPKEKRIINDLEKITKSKINIEDLPTKEMIDKVIFEQIISDLKESLNIKTDKKINKLVLDLIKNENLDVNELLLALINKHYSKNTIEVVQAPIKLNSLKSKTRKKVSIKISVGSKDKVEVNHIVCAISEATGLNSKDIGKIKIFNTYSIAEIPEDIKNQIIKKLNKTTIKNKKIEVSLEKVKKSKRQR